jgi:hypothetical protein
VLVPEQSLNTGALSGEFLKLIAAEDFNYSVSGHRVEFQQNYRTALASKLFHLAQFTFDIDCGGFHNAMTRIATRHDASALLMVTGICWGTWGPTPPAV